MRDDGIGFGTASTGESDGSDGEFLQSLSWRKSADRKLVKAARTGDVAAFCQAVRTTLAQRRAVRGNRGTAINPSRQQLLQPLWSQFAWDDPTTAEHLSKLLRELHRRLTKRSATRTNPSAAVAKHVASCLQDAPPEASPWAHVAWITILIESTRLLNDATLMSLWRRLLLGTISLMDIEPTRKSLPDDEFADDRQLLIAGELPWLSGLTFADLKGAAKVRRAGRTELRRQLEAVTDGDGTPHARALHRLPLMLAVLTRSLSAAEAFGENLFDAAAADRFARLVTRAAVMAQPDGRLALSNGASFAPASLLKTASSLSGLRPKEPSFRRLQWLADDLPAGGPSRQAKASSRLPKVKHHPVSKTKVQPSTQSDWAEVTCMRNNWSAGGDSCIVAHYGVFPQLSVTAFERLLISGDWRLAIEVDGTPVELTADWCCVCWHSDEDADFVELQLDAAGGVTLSRQVLLSRTDHWLFLADTVIADKSASLEVTARLPLASEVVHQEGRWTREISLCCEKLTARAFPLGLEQERVQKSHGAISVEDGDLVLRQTSDSGALHMPLVIDWSPDRRRSDAVWRQLTVAEDGRRLPPHDACGQRLRVGKHQWLFYRSLQPGDTGRSILGHHTAHETVVAEFTNRGEVEPIVLVESSPSL